MRQFIASAEFDNDGLLQIEGKDFRYFTHVLRLRTGDMVAVRTPSGALLNTTLAKIDEKFRRAVLQVCGGSKAGLPEASADNAAETLQSECNNETDFYLFQFVAKGPKMDLIVRQATECGVKKIIPVTGEFTQAGAAEKNFRNLRYERIIKEARQQSGSPVATEICGALSLNEALSFWKNEIQGMESQSLACVLYERNENTKSLFAAVEASKELKKCAVFCGAEGGISPVEIHILSGQGVVPVHFETNILRCETAALYGIACMQNLVMGKKEWQMRQ